MEIIDATKNSNSVLKSIAFSDIYILAFCFHFMRSTCIKYLQLIFGFFILTLNNEIIENQSSVAMPDILNGIIVLICKGFYTI